MTAEQVCQALNQRYRAVFRRRRGVPEVRHSNEVIRYHQRRNAQAAKSHKNQLQSCVSKTRVAQFNAATLAASIGDEANWLTHDHREPRSRRQRKAPCWSFATISAARSQVTGGDEPVSIAMDIIRPDV